MSEPIGWYVRVNTGKLMDGAENTALYIAGFPTPEAAVAAVKAARGKASEICEALPGEITPEAGPQPLPGEVRLIRGAG